MIARKIIKTGDETITLEFEGEQLHGKRDWAAKLLGVSPSSVSVAVRRGALVQSALGGYFGLDLLQMRHENEASKKERAARKAAK